jgi:hypothetical protein
LVGEQIKLIEMFNKNLYIWSRNNMIK